MHPGGISVARTLPIDGALLGDVLLGFRRDAAAACLRWTLGDHGVAEIDVCFASSERGWTTPARLWSPNGLAVAAASVRAEAVRADEVSLTLEPTLPPAGWGDEARGFETLAHCALDELAEELLWHASRAGLTHRR
jgi:hypothetical protein